MKGVGMEEKTLTKNALAVKKEQLRTRTKNGWIKKEVKSKRVAKACVVLQKAVKICPNKFSVKLLNGINIIFNINEKQRLQE